MVFTKNSYSSSVLGDEADETLMITFAFLNFSRHDPE